MFYAFLVYYLGIEKRKWPFLQVTGIIFLMEVVTRSVLLLLVKGGTMKLESIAFYNDIEDAVTLGYSLFLYVKALRILYKYKGLYGSVLEFDNLKWIHRFLNLGGGVIVLWLLAVLLNLFSETIKPPYSYYPLRLGSSILIYWVGYQAFFHYVILKDRIGLRGKIRRGGITHKSGNMPREQLPKRNREEAVFRDVDRFICSNQRFLDPHLSMEKIAEELSVGTSSLSRLVNQYAGKNFSDYINSLRVTEAKKLLEQDEFSAYTIVSIGLECGFNSKSTFYTAFKKFTGLTPTQYRSKK